MARVHATDVIGRLRVLVCAALLVPLCGSPSLAHAEFFAPPFLIDASFGFGVEPHDRATPNYRPSCGSDKGQQCELVLAFGVGAEVLWRGFVGIGAGLYAAEGAPVQVVGKPSFGDRISTTLAASVRPFAPLTWRRPDGFLMRLLAGVGFQLGVSVEHVRTALDSKTSPGLHFAGWLDVPLYGANTRGGLALRLSVRVLVTSEARLAELRDKDGNLSGVFQVVEPGTAAQLMAGLAYYL